MSPTSFETPGFIQRETYMEDGMFYMHRCEQSGG